jgi:hypothetical protein
MKQRVRRLLRVPPWWSLFECEPFRHQFVTVKMMDDIWEAEEQRIGAKSQDFWGGVGESIIRHDRHSNLPPNFLLVRSFEGVRAPRRRPAAWERMKCPPVRIFTLFVK